MLKFPLEIKRQIFDILEKTKIREIMVSPAITIYEDDEFSVAEEKFISHKIHYLPVVDHEQKLVGFITHKYLYKTQSPRRIQSEEISLTPDIIVDEDSFYEKDTLNSYILRHIMNKSPSSMKADQSLAEALSLLALRDIGSIPIIDNQRKVVGILTKTEIIKILAKSIV